MSFAAPAWLAGLVLPLLLLAVHLRQRSRAPRYAIRFTAVDSLRQAGAVVAPWRRHLPTALLLGALSFLVIALSRPHATIASRVQRASLILVTDHSGSMQATDVAPDRLSAAKAAAHLLINRLPDGMRVGVVGYSTVPDVVQAPQADHAAAGQAIDAQAPNGETATGEALAQALNLLMTDRARTAAIVLLSDGATNAGRDPVGVAREAARRGVPIYTVALGTPDGTVPNPDPYGAPIVVAPDPATLARIASVSGARAFNAQSAAELTSIYGRLGSKFATRYTTHQITEVFAIVGLALLVAAVAMAQAISSRLP